MREVRIEIAGIVIVFRSSGPAAPYLFDDLKKLLPGYSVGPHKSSTAICLVHCEHERTYGRRFDSEPRLVGRHDSFFTEQVFDRMETLLADPSIRLLEGIAFLNGCLFFDEGTGRGFIYLFYSKKAIHFMASLLKLIFVFTCFTLAGRDRIMVHGAGIGSGRGKDRAGYLFVGKSGAGKSTVAGLSPGGRLLSDDAVAVAVGGADAIHIHATPFRQSEMVGMERKRLYLRREKLAGIYFLHQAAETITTPREERAAFAELLKDHIHCFEIMGAPLKRQAFFVCRRLCAAAPAWDLYFRKDPSIWEIIAAE